MPRLNDWLNERTGWRSNWRTILTDYRTISTRKWHTVCPDMRRSCPFAMMTSLLKAATIYYQHRSWLLRRKMSELQEAAGRQTEAIAKELEHPSTPQLLLQRMKAWPSMQEASLAAEKIKREKQRIQYYIFNDFWCRNRNWPKRLSQYLSGSLNPYFARQPTNPVELLLNLSYYYTHLTLTETYKMTKSVISMKKDGERDRETERRMLKGNDRRRRIVSQKGKQAD